MFLFILFYLFILFQLLFMFARAQPLFSVYSNTQIVNVSFYGVSHVIMCNVKIKFVTVEHLEDDIEMSKHVL